MTGKLQRLHYRTLRALRVFNYRRPGVPLRSTPGFMLTPRFAGLIHTVHGLNQTFLQCVLTRLHRLKSVLLVEASP